ncbi:unnamed protein product [Prorocentrum cordatum]|uniref:Uncharacterized protein n=1 Tax=Prorocentrum cordatum TaxID=2364126 RepID=A0ABN9XCS9_9DINO|nr:unnamed protein product [Polarella glacialis]
MADLVANAVNALVRAALRGKGPGHRLQFEDVRQACLGAKELCFLHPLSHTLDASTFTTRSAAADLDVDEAGHVAKQRARLPAPGQRVLGAALFATAAAPGAGAGEACEEDAGAAGAGGGDASDSGMAEPGDARPPDTDSGGERTPTPRQKVPGGRPPAPVRGGPGQKRRAPASAQKQRAPRKAPRGSGAAAGGLGDFFRAGA